MIEKLLRSDSFTIWLDKLNTVIDNLLDISDNVTTDTYDAAFTFSHGGINTNTGLPSEGGFDSDSTRAVTNDIIPVFKGSTLSFTSDCPAGSATVYFYNKYDQFLSKTVSVSKAAAPYTFEENGRIRIVFNANVGKLSFATLSLLNESVKITNPIAKSYPHTDLALNIEQRPADWVVTLPSATNDGIVIGPYLYLFKANDNHTSADLYVINKYTGQLVETLTHYLGHMNSTDYNPRTDKLIFSDERDVDSVTGERTVMCYVYENFSQHLNNLTFDDPDCKLLEFPNTSGANGHWTGYDDYALFICASKGVGYNKDELGIWLCDLSDMTQLKIIRKFKGPGITQTQGVAYDGRLWIGSNWETMGATVVAIDYAAGIYKFVKRYEYTATRDSETNLLRNIEVEAVIRDGAYLYLSGMQRQGGMILARLQVGNGGYCVDEHYVKQEIDKLLQSDLNTVIEEKVNNSINNLDFENMNDNFKHNLLEYLKEHLDNNGEIIDVPDIIEDGIWDLTNDVAYVALPELQMDRTVYMELAEPIDCTTNNIKNYAACDANLWTMRKYGTAHPGQPILGMTYMYLGYNSTSGARNVDMTQFQSQPYDYATVTMNEDGSDITFANRYLTDSNVQTKLTNTVGWMLTSTESSSRVQNLETGTWYDARGRLTSGVICDYSGYMYFNHRSNKNYNNSKFKDIHNFVNTTELNLALREGFCSVGFPGMVYKIKRFILFNGIIYNNVFDVLNNREQAEIDIRFKNGKPFNAGTGAPLIYSDTTGQFSD